MCRALSAARPPRLLDSIKYRLKLNASQFFIYSHIVTTVLRESVVGHLLKHLATNVSLFTWEDFKLLSFRPIPFTSCIIRLNKLNLVNYYLAVEFEEEGCSGGGQNVLDVESASINGKAKRRAGQGMSRDGMSRGEMRSLVLCVREAEQHEAKKV